MALHVTGVIWCKNEALKNKHFKRNKEVKICIYKKHVFFDRIYQTHSRPWTVNLYELINHVRSRNGDIQLNLDSDSMNFKTFVFLTLIEPSEHHNTNTYRQRRRSWGGGGGKHIVLPPQ